MKFCLLNCVLNSNLVIHRRNSLFAHSVYSLTMVDAMYENSPENLKNFKDDSNILFTTQNQNYKNLE